MVGLPSIQQGYSDSDKKVSHIFPWSYLDGQQFHSASLSRVCDPLMGLGPWPPQPISYSYRSWIILKVYEVFKVLEVLEEVQEN